MRTIFLSFAEINNPKLPEKDIYRHFDNFHVTVPQLLFQVRRHAVRRLVDNHS